MLSINTQIFDSLHTTFVAQNDLVRNTLYITICRAECGLEQKDLTSAIEPDTCFYIQNERRVRGKDKINLPSEPPPDLAMESYYTKSSLNKFNIYASLQVPELWRDRHDLLEVYHLVEGKYERRDRSLAFPFLPLAEIPHFIAQSKTIGQRAAVRLFRQRIREILAAG